MATPLANTCSTTGKRRIPPASDHNRHDLRQADHLQGHGRGRDGLLAEVGLHLPARAGHGAAVDHHITGEQQPGTALSPGLV